MLHAKFRSDGVIETLQIGKSDNIIFPWSIEFGDSAGYFSQDLGGLRVGLEKREQRVESREGEVKSSGNIRVMMTDGVGNLEYGDAITGKQVNRVAKLTAESDMLLMDFVQQYRFKREAFDFAEIAEHKVEHRNGNKYYEFETNEVVLRNSEFEIRVSVTDWDGAGKFKQVMYVRDYPGQWIVHVRLLPLVVAENIVKLNIPWYNRALPQILGRAALACKPLRDFIWYRPERSPYPKWQLPFKILQPAGYSLSRLEAGEQLTLKSTCKVVNSQDVYQIPKTEQPKS